MSKRIISVIIALLLAVLTPFTVLSYDINTLDGVKTSIEGVISYKSSVLNASSTNDFLDLLSEKAGTYSSDWYYIALSQYGVNCRNEKSISALKNTVDDFYKEGIENVKVTDLQRVALALSACGQDITNVNGHNLLADATYNREKYKSLDAQGVNSLAYALILLDSKHYVIPKNSKLSRNDITDKILSYELKNGGYALFGNGADVDITSIVIQSLSPYKNNSKVKNSINNSLEILSRRQDINGAFKSFDNKVTAESTAQVIIALTSLNINPVSDKRFIKNEKTTLDGLNLFKNEDGGYCHMTGLSTNSIATYQSLCALVSVYNFLNGNGALYNFSEKEKSNNKIVEKVIKKKTTNSLTNNSKRIKKSVKDKKHSAGSNNVNKNTAKRNNNTSIKKSSRVIKNDETKNNSNTENKSRYSQSYTQKINQKTYKTPEKNEEIKRKQKNTVPLNKNNDSVPNIKPRKTEEIINKKTKSNSKTISEPLYIDFIILLAGYIALFCYKSRR